MLIVDKNTDFYDYLQNIYRDDNLTLDRTDSFLLTKEEFKSGLSGNFRHYWRYCDIDAKNPAYKFVLLQMGYTYWLFSIEITKIDIDENLINYSVNLLNTWKNYNKPHCLVSLVAIDFPYKILYNDYHKLDKDYLIKRTPVLVQAVNMGEYKIEHDYCVHRTHRFVKSKLVTEEKHFPLLKACGLSVLLDPLDVYLALEECLSSEKTSSERTSSIGITDKEKIENHGFDLKSSFRG